MLRFVLPTFAVLALTAGLLQCSDESGINAGDAPGVVGTWTSGIQLSPDSTVFFSILLAADSTDTMNAAMSLTLPFLGRDTVPAYREAGRWSVVGDSLLVMRITCETNTIPSHLGAPVWTSGNCNSSTAKLPINISGDVWTVKFADLRPYIPAGFAVPVGYDDNTDVRLIRQ